MLEGFVTPLDVVFAVDPEAGVDVLDGLALSTLAASCD
jgi:hypothetical protein